MDHSRYFGDVPGAGCAGAETGAAAGAGAVSGTTGAGAGVAVPLASEPAEAGVDIGAVSPGAAGAELPIAGAGVCAPGFTALALLALSPIVSRIDFGGAATARVPT